MSAPILTTKLYRPPSPPKVVARPRLIKQLNSGLHCKLTLVSASAGFGKTTLVSDWLADIKRPVAWLSLDDGDSDFSRFLTYVISALQTIMPKVGEGMVGVLQSPQPPSTESLLTSLINELTALTEDILLVLDDYHVIESEAIDNALLFLIDHLPPKIHLVVITREDPLLPLARLRARGQLTELRLGDLRFTVDEASYFLNQVMGLDLSTYDVEALEERTEGWIAGLQLAAISMRGYEDAQGFIQSFTGSHHFVADYLVEEVLKQQPTPIQDFLRYTSVLNQLCAPLCDSLLPDLSISSRDMLSAIEQANLFLIPLDNERQWYRYHHLFADLLRQRLNQIDDNDIAELHRRASVWYEANDYELEAFHHATHSNDIERVEHLLEGEGMPLVLRGAVKPILNWLTPIPKHIVESRPSLLVTYAFALTFSAIKVETIEEKLQLAESLLQTVELDDTTYPLFGHIAVIRAMLAIPQNQIDTIIKQSERALEYLPPEHQSIRLNFMWTLGYAYQEKGDLASARKIYSEVIPLSEASGNIMATIAAKLGLGSIQQAENQLHLAYETYQSVLQIVGEFAIPSVSLAHIGLAQIHAEWNDLDLAFDHAKQGFQLAQQMVTVDVAVSGGNTLARIQFALGDIQGANTSLEQAEQFARQHNFTSRLSDIAQIRAEQQKSQTFSPDNQSLIEPLTERELEVLRLIAIGLSNRDIGERLFLALDTIKGHNRRIYAKLGVQRRTEAVARAQELGLL